MRVSDGFDDADWRAVIVVLCALGAAAAAHGAAGGGVPGPGGISVLFLMLVPVALATRAWARGRISLLIAASVAQLVGHVGLSLVTVPPGGGGCSPDAVAAHAGHGMATPATCSASAAQMALNSSTDTFAPGGMSKHLFEHFGLGMLAAHVVAAVLTAVLVHALTAALRRFARRFVALLRTVFATLTPHRPSCARPILVAPPRIPVRAAHPRRGPPLLA